MFSRRLLTGCCVWLLPAEHEHHLRLLRGGEPVRPVAGRSLSHTRHQAHFSSSLSTCLPAPTPQCLPGCVSEQPHLAVLLLPCGSQPFACRCVLSPPPLMTCRSPPILPCPSSPHPPCTHPPTPPQVRAKYNSTLVDVFRETFCWLPLGYVLNSKVLVVHGGLFSKDGVKLDDLRAIDRNRCVRTPCGPPLMLTVRSWCSAGTRVWLHYAPSTLQRRGPGRGIQQQAAGLGRLLLLRSGWLQPLSRRMHSIPPCTPLLPPNVRCCCPGSPPRRVPCVRCCGATRSTSLAARLTSAAWASPSVSASACNNV